MELYLHSLICIHGVHRDYITLLHKECFLPANECISWAATACSRLMQVRRSKAHWQVQIRSISRGVALHRHRYYILCTVMALIRFTSKNIDPFTGISILWMAARKLYLTLCSPAVLNLHGILKPQSRFTLWGSNIHTKGHNVILGRGFRKT
jgi:hypothetical protein